MNDDIRENGKITIEFILYASILIIGLVLRVILLDRVPLNEEQSRLAMDALRIAQGKDAIISGQPGYLSFTAMIFFLFKATNFFARFWPALIGVLVVLLPLLFKERLGKNTAILLSFLLGIDPFLIGASRATLGGIFALVGLFAGIGFWQKNKPMISGIGFGLVFLGGVDMWPGALMLFLAAIAAFGGKLLVAFSSSHKNKKQAFTVMIISFVFTVLIISTVFLTHPAGISTVGSSLAEYFQSWKLPMEVPFHAAGLTWLLLQFPVLCFGIWGLISGIKTKDQSTVFLGIWWGLSLLIAILNPSRNLAELFWVSVPMLTLAARSIVLFVTDWKIESKVVFVVESTAVIALVIFSVMNFANLINSNGLDSITLRNRVLGVLLPLILLVVVSALFAWGWSMNSTLKGLVLGFGLVLFGAWMGSTWKVADLGSRPEFEVKYGGSYPVGDKILLSTLNDLSRRSNGQAYRIDIQVAGMDSNSLNWALRDFDNLSFEPIFNPKTSPSVVLTDVNTEIQAESIYRGQKILWSIQPDYDTMTIKDWMRWSFFRVAPQKNIELILWAKNDIFSDQKSQ